MKKIKSLRNSLLLTLLVLLSMGGSLWWLVSFYNSYGLLGLLSSAAAVFAGILYAVSLSKRVLKGRKPRRLEEIYTKIFLVLLVVLLIITDNILKLPYLSLLLFMPFLMGVFLGISLHFAVLYLLKDEGSLQDMRRRLERLRDEDSY